MIANGYNVLMDYLDRNHKAVLEFMVISSYRFDNFAFPIKTHHEFDLIALEKGKPYRVRIICTHCKNTQGNYVANLLKSGAHAKIPSKKKHFDPKDCDIVFVWTPDQKYIIPTENIDQSKAITLSMFESFIVS